MNNERNNEEAFNFDAIVSKGRLNDEEEAKLRLRCFNAFKSSQCNGLSINDFTNLVERLFVEPNSGKSYHIPKPLIEKMFAKFDIDNSGFISLRDFETMWNKWIRVILWPKSALLVVDVQNDFISGSLAISNCPAGHKGEDVVPVINRLIQEVKFDQICYTFDWHPEDHISFIENVKLRKVIERNGQPIVLNGGCDPLENLNILETLTFECPSKRVQTLWPKHCVQNTVGAELHSDLFTDPKAIKIYKGTNPSVDSYSAFWDNCKLSATSLHKELSARGITDVYVCGIAYDVCVNATALHSLEHGYRTIVINDASRGVDLKEISKCKDNLITKHCVIIESDDVKRMVAGIDRRLELAYFSALQTV